MNVQGNLYTFIYASIMVIVVAAVLSFTAMQLQPIQEKNVEAEKMQNILATIKVESTRNNAAKLYKQYITESYVINHKGEKIQGADAFTVDMKKQLSKPVEERHLPLFYAEGENGSKRVIVPVRGKGLWGPIWGFVAFEDDYNTIYGVTFDHKGETPGLGAEINKHWFEEPFQGKTIFNESGEFVSIQVYKGGQGAAENAGDTEHGVDGISGGTITSNGLEDMLDNCLEPYVPYFKQQQK